MKSVVFCVSETEKADLDHYAKAKGLRDAGSLARFAVARYMAQFPLGTRQKAEETGRGTPERPKTEAD